MAPRPKLIVSTILGTLAYLGLAILGLGGFAAFFSHPALIALTVVFFLSRPSRHSAPEISAPASAKIAATAGCSRPFGVISLLTGVCAGLRQTGGTVDHRRRRRALAWRRSSFAAGGALRIVAGVRARPPLQRIGRDPARAHARHAWGSIDVIRHPAISVSSSPRWDGRSPFVPGLGVLLRALLHPEAAVSRASNAEETAAALALRRRVRCLLPPHVPAPPRHLLVDWIGGPRAPPDQNGCMQNRHLPTN